MRVTLIRQNLLKIWGLTRTFTIVEEIKWLYLAFENSLKLKPKAQSINPKEQLVNPITP